MSSPGMGLAAQMHGRCACMHLAEHGCHCHTGSTYFTERENIGESSLHNDQLVKSGRPEAEDGGGSTPCEDVSGEAKVHHRWHQADKPASHKVR